MKRAIGIMVFLFVAGIACFAVEADVAVLYNGNTPTNVDGLHFMTQRFAEKGAHRVQGIRDPKEILPGKYKAIVVLSTGLSSGVDRNLADFIASWQKKPEIILVSLKKGTKDLSVLQYPPSPDNLGVDAITAASVWSGKGLAAIFGGKNSAEYDMHVDWVDRVIALVDKMR